MQTQSHLLNLRSQPEVMTTHTASYKVSGSKSNFSHKYNLLSAYLREKRSLAAGVGDLGAGHGSIQGMTTKNLFPQEAGSGFSDASSTAPGAGGGSAVAEVVESPAQMTIFYGGQVIVLSQLTADKAKEVFQLASEASSSSSSSMKSASKSIKTASDLPIARKGSIQRFLEKRKDRISASKAAAAPYSLNRYDSMEKLPRSMSKQCEYSNQSWLCLAPRRDDQCSNPDLRL